MSFSIQLGINREDKRVINKTFTASTTLTGTLKNETSIINPTILIDVDLDTIASYNYMYISEFGRYYYITDAVSVTNKLCMIHAHVDVLKSFASDIYSSSGIENKSKSDGSWLLNDGSLQVYQPTTQITKNFSGGFTDYEFVLAVAGS